MNLQCCEIADSEEPRKGLEVEDVQFVEWALMMVLADVAKVEPVVL